MHDIVDRDWKRAADRAASNNLARVVFGPLLLRQPGHDVSDEPRDEQGRWTEGGGGGGDSGPSSIPESLAQAEAAHQAHLNRVKAALDALPIGYEIKYKSETFTHTNVGGDKFWISDKGKGYTAIQFYEHVGTQALISHIGHEALGQINEIGEHVGQGTGASESGHPEVAGGQQAASEPGQHFVSLAQRGVISHDLAAELTRRANNVDNNGKPLGYGSPWPEDFQKKLAGALEDLPPAMREWAGKADESGFVPLRINYRANLDEVPPGLRSAYETAAAVTVNHARIEFIQDRFPTPETLRHEMTHLAWYDLTRNRYDSFGGPKEGGGPAGAAIDEAVGEIKKAGNDLVKFSSKVGSKTKPPPAPAGVDPDEWFRLWQAARSVRKDVNFLRKYKRAGTLSSSQMKGSLELHLMVPSDDTVRLAKYLGHELPSAQLGTIAEYHGIAKALDVPLRGEFAEEEPVAYRAGIDKAFAERLFASINAKKNSLRWWRLVLRQPGHDVSDEPRDELGRWTEGGGGDGGDGDTSGAGSGGPQGELFPGQFPPIPEPKVKTELPDFQKDEVRLDAETRTDDEKAKKFLDKWNENIGEAPAQFKKDFLGGLPATMSIDYNGRSRIVIMGKLLNNEQSTIGEYTRTIDFDDKAASSDFFELNRGQGHGIGKQMLKANVEMYQKLGLSRVSVHANLNVGGYAWAKYGYVPTPRSWRNLSSELDDKLREMTGGGGYEPSSWEEIGDQDQDRIRDAWKAETHDEFYESEINSWRDSGGDLAQAKSDLAHFFIPGQPAWPTWARGALASYGILVDADKETAHVVSISSLISNEKLLSATTIEYDDRHGDGREDPDITIDDTKTPELTDDQRKQIESVLVEAFNKRAEAERGSVDPPDYINDNISEFQNDSWDSMRDRDKFRWAQDHGELPTETEGTGEVDESDAQTLRELIDSGDPKAIWAIADSALGKELLLGTDWEGELDFGDEESMERFNAYVGKSK